jgi:hypothetical protein
MELIDTRDGNVTIKANNSLLHSKYSPKKEANKFIQKSIKHSTGTVIVIGAGLGYIYSEIEELYPDLEIVGLPLIYNSTLLQNSIKPKRGIVLNSLENIDVFLNKALTENNIRGLQIIEWQPTIGAMPESYNTVNNALIKRVRRVNGNLLTTARFGKLWIKNSLKNYINIESYITGFTIDTPIVIIASGSSLSNLLECIKRERSKIMVIALSSSLAALREAQIVPDLVFSTDPGYYSKLHLYGYNGPLAMPLSNSTGCNSPTLLINNGNFFENEIYNTQRIPAIKIPENGTVAGTALLFALHYSKSKIYLCGQDLCSNDIKSHISPYAFDNLLKKDELRINPYYSTMYTRWIRSGVTYNTYRDWYSSIGNRDNSRVSRVAPYGPPLESIQDITKESFENEIKNLGNKEFKYTTEKSPTRLEKNEFILKLLNSWLENLRKKISIKELIYLISPGKTTDESTRDSIGYLKELLKLYGRKLL